MKGVKIKMMDNHKIKNVILVSLDATSPGRLSCYGHERETTPNIEKALAEGGTIKKTRL